MAIKVECDRCKKMYDQEAPRSSVVNLVVFSGNADRGQSPGYKDLCDVCTTHMERTLEDFINGND